MADDAGLDAGDGDVTTELDSGPDAARVVDGGDGSPDAGPDEGTEIPNCAERFTALPGIVMWLDATTGVVANAEQHVEEWSDSSSYGNTASSAGNPEGTGRCGCRRTSSGTARYVSGTAPRRSAARRMKVPDAPSLQFGTGSFAIIAVLRYRNPAEVNPLYNDTGLIYGKQSTISPYVGPVLFANDNYDFTQELLEREDPVKLHVPA